MRGHQAGYQMGFMYVHVWECVIEWNVQWWRCLPTYWMRWWMYNNEDIWPSLRPPLLFPRAFLPSIIGNPLFVKRFSILSIDGRGLFSVALFPIHCRPFLGECVHLTLSLLFLSSQSLNVLVEASK